MLYTIFCFSAQQRARRPFHAFACCTLLVLTFMLLSGCSNATGINPTNSPTRPVNAHPALLNSVRMFDAQQGWALSEHDEVSPVVYSIVRTTDGGQFWQDVTPRGYTLYWSLVNFLSPQVAWVVTPQRNMQTTQILRTTDGGQTWQGSTIATNGVSAIDFLDSQHGWLVSSDDNDLHFDIWHAIDGKTWRDIAHVTPQLKADSQLHITGISFVNAPTGWLTGSTVTNAPWFYVTHDGGQSWQAQALAVPEQVQALNPGLWPPAFLNNHDGFLVMNGATLNCAQQALTAIVYTTHDGGITWNSTSITNLNSMPSFISSMQGWGIADRALKITTNGGHSWENIPADAAFKSALDIQNIQFVSSTVGWASGRDQQKFPLLLKTTDGGRSWSVVKPQVFTATQSQLALDQTLQAPGSAPNLSLPAPISSRLPAYLPVTPSVVNIHMFDARNGWGETPGGKYSLPHLLHTSDGGKTWRDVLPRDEQSSSYGTSLLADDFLDASTAWFALTVNRGSAIITSIYRTTDGGQSWQEAAITLKAANSGFVARRITFSDASHGWLLLTDTQEQSGSENAYIYGTADGGQQWTQLSTTGTSTGSIPLSGDKVALSFLNAQTGWLAVGDYSSLTSMAGLYRTLDGGHTWTKQSVPIPAGLATATAMTMAPTFFDASHGILPVQYYNGASSQGTIVYRTNNGGASWQVISLLHFLFSAFDFLDTNHGWITDSTGTILSITIDGGQHWTQHTGFKNLLSISFPSTRLGWGEDSNTCSLLLQTSDGGQSWSDYQYSIVA